MVLTYMEVHLYYTLPALGVLLYLLKPYHVQEDGMKYKFLSMMAFVTASIWDNYIVYHRAWSYCSTCVVAVVGYVPLEEYMFFIIMSLMTVAFTNLIMRWSLVNFYIKPFTPISHSLIIRFVPIAGLLTLTYKSWNLAIPDKPLFYGSCILWYACPVLALLWYGAGEYMLRRPIAVLTSILVPTLYLCWVDVIAIGAGTWHISLRTSTGKMVVPNLPVEEFMFFLLINTVLVFGTCAIDRVLAIIRLNKGEYSNKFGQNSLWKQLPSLLWAFCMPDQFINHTVLEDFQSSWNILRHASKSFYTASAVFPAPIRQDLGILYGFCRVTDDLCDNEQVSVQERKEQLKVVYEFVNELFSQKQSHPTVIQWEAYQEKLPQDCLAAFRSFTRLRQFLEIGAVQELLDGYQWDLDRKAVLNEQDLSQYSACVASSVGEMCTRIILAHSQEYYQPGEIEWIVERAREMGLVLQYTNIARDIVTDSQELKRCYLPATWLTLKEMDLICSGQARELGDKRLLNLSGKLIDEANQLMMRANKGITRLPKHCQGGVRAACNVYASIGKVLKQQKSYPNRAHVGKWQRSKIALLSVYDLFDLNLNQANSNTKKGKVRGFMVE